MVVDNGAEPPNPRKRRRASPTWSEASRGAYGARHIGLGRARDEYVLLRDDGPSLESPGIMARAVITVEEYRHIGAIAFLQPMPDGRLNNMQPTSRQSPSPVARFFGYGCLLRMRALDEIGGFQPDFGHYDEKLLLLDASYTIRSDAAWRVVHHEDGNGRDARRINRLLRNSVFTAILRYTARCVAPGLLVHVYRYLRITWNSGIRDWGGRVMDRVATDEVLRLPMRERRPVRFATMRQIPAPER